MINIERIGGEGSTGSVQEGLLFVDDVQRQQYRVMTTTTTAPTRESASDHYYPVDRSWSLTLSEARLPSVPAILVRSHDGDLVADIDHHEIRSFDPGRYVLEINASIKFLWRIDCGFSISTAGDVTTIAFDERTEVRIGARSFHDRPAGTITTPTDPQSLMSAVSHLSSSIKTSSCERSFPTLRGHPPRIEPGDEFSVPDGIEPLDTPARIECPTECAAIFTLAPLSYYLGADLVPGDWPRLVADDFSRELDGEALDREVAEILRQVFFFDTITRTEGFYEVQLHERESVESRTDLDFERLYGADLSAQLRAYLDVDYATIDDLLPQWLVTADVLPKPRNVEALSYLLDDLALIRSPEATATSKGRDAVVQRIDAVPTAVDVAARSEADRGPRSGPRPAVDPNLRYRPTEPTESLEHVWVGDGVPIGTSKFVRAGYENGLEWSSEGDISVRVICNHRAMAGEVIEDRLYGDREMVPFDVTASMGVTTDELLETLREPLDFLHFVGHVRDDAFVCPDGRLPFDEIDDVEVGSFLINGCQSYRVGRHLVEQGSAGGIVTITDVENSDAMEVGQVVAQLLNAGFSLGCALTIAREEGIVGEQYITVGQRDVRVTQPSGTSPNLCEIDRLDATTYEVEIVSYPTEFGSLFRPHIQRVTERYLVSGSIDTYRLDKTELFRFLTLGRFPVRYEGELTWSGTLADEL